jgi:ABC-type enterochelin transport system ATPase subunit
MFNQKRYEELENKMNKNGNLELNETMEYLDLSSLRKKFLEEHDYNGV